MGVTVKKCSFCGQEIASDATFCMFCNRAQPVRTFGGTPQKVSYTRRAQLVVALGAGLAAALMVSRLIRQPATFERLSEKPTGQKVLRVSGSRYSRGIEVINREAEPLAGCVISIPDRARSGEWTASVQKLAPGEPTTVTWAEFRKKDGDELPPNVGETARYATIKCDSHKETHKGAALVFR